MLDTISPPAVDRYVPADDEDELSESPTHNAQMDLTLYGLRQACAAWNEPFYVLGNVEVLAEGLPRVCPDHALLRGVREVEGDSYDVRSTGIVPCVVFEYCSKKSGDRDRGEKYEIYEKMGVREYFICDLARQTLAGYRLTGKRFAPLERLGNGRLRSAELGVELGLWDGYLRMFRGKELLAAGTELLEALADKDAELAERDRVIEELRRRLDLLQSDRE